MRLFMLDKNQLFTYENEQYELVTDIGSGVVPDSVIAENVITGSRVEFNSYCNVSVNSRSTLVTDPVFAER